MAQGHMIPMVDLARLLAAAGVQVTFITTPVNTARIRPIIDRIERSALPIHFVDLRFPTAEAGLPDGCENIDLIPSRNLFKPFIEALPLLRPQLELYLSAAPPDCIIFDSMNSWAAAAAKDLEIPHLIFHGPSCFYMLCSLLLEKSQILKSIAGDFDPFLIPGLPEPVEVMKAQVTRASDAPGWEKIKERFLAAQESAHGIVINTFEELELSVLEKYKKETGKKLSSNVWSIGPLSISNADVDSLSTRGEASSTDAQWVINWLDSKAPDSVMFVCFGSLVLNPLSQLIEIGRGLEHALSSLSSLSFIWVVKEAAKSEEVEKWLSEFEKKMSVRGMIIRGWAPQVIVLTHVAVGGFMTHCGWNSVLEAVAAGVVMVTWPRYVGDQFINEKLVVDVLKVGVSVGAKVPASLVKEMSGEAQVKGEDVGKAVVRVMDGEREGEERRTRARELGEKARKAMKEGGSSFENLKEIIQFARQTKIVME
ncbi:UDP-glycosyltransferase 73C3 [Platanthera zijinensis]|uniref:UDP-glycosyltransferase 73C3 n=1 Tax=Platanthera zijinensis TaxID=2320716 RepID=A0AAP0BF96_9ASPA